MNINKTNCPLFDTGLYIEKVNQSQARIAMCCFQDLSPELYSSVDFDHNNYLEQLRGITNNVNQCKLCVLAESQGRQSHRQAHILANRVDTASEKKLTTLTYNCENTCNLACLTCGPRYSSKWKPDYKRMGIHHVTVEKESSHNNAIYQQLDLSELRFLHFQGGEPLLTDDHENVLTKLQQQNNLENVVVSYNTNGNFLPTDRALDLWRQAQLVKLNFSIDAVGEQYNIIRNPGKWQEVQEILSYYKHLDMSNLWIEIGTTISLANLFYLQDIISWRDQHFAQTQAGDNIKIYMSLAGPMSYGGKVLSLNNITSGIKTAALEYVSALSDTAIRNTLVPIIQKLTPQAHCNEAQEYLDKIDQFRGTEWKNTLSKLYTAINE